MPPITSLTLAQLQDRNELFPMLTLCNCVSDAEESRNGPRYSAQDKINKCMYEMRCLPLEIPNTDPSGKIFLRTQQLRLDALIAAAQEQDLPPCVSFPIDVYVQDLTSTNEYFVVSVSSCMGLSLGDIIHAGCRLVEEADFEDILRCVEAYGLFSTRLPPHRNLTLSALLRQLAARTGAVEMSHRSRWVIADWLLLSDCTAPVSPDEVLGDLEWLLYSAFSKLNVSCDFDGTLLRREVVEMRINDTIERIRRGLRDGVVDFREATLNGDIRERESPRVGNTVVGSMHLADCVALHQRRLQRERQFIKACRGGGGTHKRGGAAALGRTPVEPTGTDGLRRQLARWMMTAGMTISPSHVLSDILPSGLNARHALGGQDAIVLDAATAALNGWAKCDEHRHIAEDEACRRQRDAFRAMLMRYTAVSGKLVPPPSREVIRGSHAVAGQLTQSVSNSSPRNVPMNMGQLLRGITVIKEETPTQTDSAYDSLDRERQLMQEGREKEEQENVLCSVSNANLSLESEAVAPQEVNTASGEHLLIKNYPHARREVPMLCLKNILNMALVSKSGRKSGQKNQSQKADFVFSAHSNESSPTHENVASRKNQRLATANTRLRAQRERSIHSVQPDTSGTMMRPRRIGEMKATSTLSNTPVIATTRDPGEKVSNNVTQPSRSEASSRLPRRRSSSVTLVSGSVSRGQVRPVNETSLGITLRRRQPGVSDAIC